MIFRPVLSLIIAFAGYSLLNISQAAQKIGLSVVKKRKLPGYLLWIAATLGIFGSSLATLAALSLGNVSLVGAMAGSGLASLALFSWLVMKEKITPRELIGVGIIISAAVFIGAFTYESGDPVPRVRILFLFLGIVCVLYSVLWALFNRRNSVAAPVIAGFSGTLGGFVALFQKLSTTEYGRSQSIARGIDALEELLGPAAETLSNPYTLAWVAAGFISMVILQFSYRRGKAIQIIPWFSTTSIIIPVIGGMLVFGERLHVLQWCGLVLMVAGVLFLTVKEGEHEEVEGDVHFGKKR